ncbi:MAG: hypothetical protein ACLSG5_16875 [Oscillospiraceae bacterium]
MSLYDELRRKHGSFIYHSYEFTEQDGRAALVTFQLTNTTLPG